MSNHEITFNTNVSGTPTTRADFTYKISPTVISIFDTGLGKFSVSEDIETTFVTAAGYHFIANTCI
jgi:hypothetical protein